MVSPQLLEKQTKRFCSSQACLHLSRVQIHLDMAGSIRKHLVQQDHNHSRSLQKLVTLSALMNSMGKQRDSSCKSLLKNPYCSSEQTATPSAMRCTSFPSPCTRQLYQGASFKCCVAAFHLNIIHLPSSTPPLLSLSAQQLWLSFCKNIPPPALWEWNTHRHTHRLSTQAAITPSAMRKQTASPQHLLLTLHGD